MVNSLSWRPPVGSAVSGAAIRNCLIDVLYDRQHRHPSRKGERKGHSYEYLCHDHPWDIVIEATMLNIRMLFLRKNTY